MVLLPFWQTGDGPDIRSLESASSDFVVQDVNLLLPPGDLIPFDRQRVPSGYAVVSPDIFLESAVEYIEGFEGFSPERKSVIGDIQTSRLVHVPFYEITYEVPGGTYECLLDINSEQFFADSVPPSASRAITSTFALLALGLFVVYSLAGMAVNSAGLRFLVIMALSVPSYFIIERMIKLWKI